MKVGRSLDDVATAVEYQNAVKADYVASAPQLHLSQAGLLSFPKSEGYLPLTALGHSQLGEYLDIPSPYYKRMLDAKPELLSHNVNAWLSGKTGERRMIRTLEGKVRAVLSDRYRRLDNYDVMVATLQAMAGRKGLVMRSCEVTDNRLYIKVSDPSVVGLVPDSKRPGDMVEAGFMVSNSEVGLGRLSIKPFNFFRICSNGAVRDGGKAWVHVGRKLDETVEAVLSDETKALDDKALLAIFSDVLKSIMDPSAHMAYLASLGDATKKVIEGDPVAAVEETIRLTNLNKNDRAGILKHLIEGADLSQYGLMNAVTRYAEDQESYDRASDLEAIGAGIVGMPAAQWRRIATAVAA